MLHILMEVLVLVSLLCLIFLVDMVEVDMVEADMVGADLDMAAKEAPVVEATNQVAFHQILLLIEIRIELCRRIQVQLIVIAINLRFCKLFAF